MRDDLRRALVLFSEIKDIEKIVNNRIVEVIKIIHNVCGDSNLALVDPTKDGNIHNNYRLQTISSINKLIKYDTQEIECISYRSIYDCKSNEDIFIYNKYLHKKRNLKDIGYFNFRFPVDYIFKTNKDIEKEVKEIVEYGKKVSDIKNKEKSDKKYKRYKRQEKKKAALSKLTQEERKVLGIK